MAAPLPSKDVLGVPHRRRPFHVRTQESGAPQSGWMARRREERWPRLESRRGDADDIRLSRGMEGWAPSEARFFDQPQMPPRPERCVGGVLQRGIVRRPGRGISSPSWLID